ncbi:hypothetical protein MB901379_03448 [Mycobacterium basiliense]|uniref:Uncharacterized protein n=1 Tax=Mycobacterium basiliense TaxID=2094119 RepID=A0A3S4FSM8_9MYCO|nr:hypothetical protein MB901379_03448 [Mycobacterium basiliense]
MKPDRAGPLCPSDFGVKRFTVPGVLVSMLQKLPHDQRDAELPLRFISAAPIDAPTPIVSSNSATTVASSRCMG